MLKYFKRHGLRIHPISECLTWSQKYIRCTGPPASLGLAAKRIMTIVLLAALTTLAMNTTLAINTALLAQQPDTEPSSVATSIAEVKERQKEPSSGDIPFKLQARLSFCTPLIHTWRMQDGRLSLSCRTHSAQVKNVVYAAQLGDLLEISGVLDSGIMGGLQVRTARLVEQGNADDLEIVPVFPDLDESVWAYDTARLWRFVEFTGVVDQVMTSSLRTEVIFREAGGLIKFVDYAPITGELCRSLPERRIRVTGAAVRSSHRKFDGEPTIEIRAMNASQLRLVDDRPPATPVAVIRNQPVTYVTPNYMLVDGKKVLGEHVHRVKLGNAVDVNFASYDPVQRSGVAAAIVELGQMPRVPAPLIQAEAIDDAESLYRQVSIIGTVEEFSVAGGDAMLKVRSNDKIIKVILNPDKIHDFDGMDFESGAIVRLTGFVERDDLHREANAQPARLLVTSDDDIELVDGGVSFTNTTARSVGLGALGVLALVCGWQWTLQRRVRSAAREIRATEAKATAATRAVRAGILMFDLEGTVTCVDEKLERLLGRTITSGTRHHDLLAGTLANMFRDQGSFEQMWTTAFQEPQFTGALEAQVAEGTRYLEIHTAPVPDIDGGCLGRIWTFEDITTRKEQDKIYLEAQKSHAIGRVASGVAHDFNNLLQVVNANLEVCQAHFPNGDEQIDTALIAVDRAQQLARQLQVYANQSSMEHGVADVEVIMKDVSNFMSRLLAQGVDFRFHVAPNTGSVIADKNHLQHVLINLCLNARDALPAEAGLIELTAEPFVDDHKPWVRIRVTDNGVGIPNELRERVFEPFFTTKAPGNGTGLGLAIAKAFVTGLGGTIACESPAGKGTCIEINLPAATTAPEACTDTHAPSGETDFKSILVVDDDPLVLKSSAMLMTHLGHTVRAVSSGEQAIELVAAGESFDVIFIDYRMPNMNGFETLQQIRQLDATIPLVICSGNAEDHDESSDSPTPDAFLHKPYRADDIKKVFAEITLSTSSSSSTD